MEHLKTQGEALKRGPLTPAATLTPGTPATAVRSRRPRSPEEVEGDSALVHATETKRHCPSQMAAPVPTPHQQREPKRTRLAVDQPPTPTTPKTPTVSFAEAVASSSPPPTPGTSSQTAPSAPATVQDATKGGQVAGGSKNRYPPLVVEKMPNWASHFRTLKEKLGRAPNARPFGQGVKFSPTEDHEYRLIQRYLTELEKTENVSWFSYSLPADRSLKVAIRGLPVDTEPADITTELSARGYEPEYVRPIRARRGRPGCIFLAILRRTPGLTPGIYDTDELLCMPGVRIEAWRAKAGPSQCHRCQQFRHSSHNCHRRQACVRCGEEHAARDCKRAREVPATCANCGGPHPANHSSCPVYKKEARNKRAGTVAISGGERRTAEPIPAPGPEVLEHERPSTSLMAAANAPTARGSTSGPEATIKKRRRRRRGKKPRPAEEEEPRTQAPVAPPPATTNTTAQKPHHPRRPAQAPATTTAATEGRPPRISSDRLAVVEAAIDVLHRVLVALRAGEDPAKVVLRGMGELMSNFG